MFLNKIIDYRFWFLAVSSLCFLSACAQGRFPTFRQPNRLFDVSAEETLIKNVVTDSTLSPRDTTERNNFISLRMYAIDLEYTKYEAQLLFESQGIHTGFGLVDAALKGATALTPSASTAKALAAVGLGMSSASGVYDKEILLAQSMQNIQTQMRANRNEQGAKILANMGCDLRTYPYGRALSDLESYYRAGTMAAGLMGVTATVNKGEVEAKAKKDAANPAPEVRESGKQQLDNTAALAATQATVPAKRKNSYSLCSG